MNYPKINLHIHSNYSDGKNTIEQIVDKALKTKFNYIAITDHFTNSWKSKIIDTLDSEDKISDYLMEIELINEWLRENKEKLKVLKGVEIDLESSFNYIKRNINPKAFDIILFEHLETPESIGFIQRLINEWKNMDLISQKTPIFGLAHFDPSYFMHSGLNILLNFLKKNNIYFEFNSNYEYCYSTKYKNIFFDRLKSKNISVAISSDSHSINELNNIEEPLSMIDYYNLNQNFQKLINSLENLD